MRLGSIVVVALLVMPAVAEEPPGIPWNKVQGIQVDDFKDEFLKSVAVLLEKLPCYGHCTESIAACLRKDPTPTTAVRLARDVLNLAAASTSEEEIRKWVQIRARMAQTGDVHNFNLAGLVPLGRKDAPVVVVEFTDFQCPICGRVSPDLEKVVRSFGDRACLFLKQFPLKVHPRSIEAAKACVSAAAFDKTWELCPRLFEIQSDLSDSALLKLAEQVGIPVEGFKKEMLREETLSRIADDKMEGLKHKIEGTPAIFINGRELALEPTAALLQDRIQEELDKLAGKD